MPKTRRPQPAKVRQAVVNQWRAHIDYAAALSPEQLAEPSKLTGWDVRTLVGHVAFTVHTVRARAAEPVAGVEAEVYDWMTATPTAAAVVDAGTRELVAEGAVLADEVAEAEKVMARYGDEEPIAMRFGGMRFDDFLVSRIVEAVVHGDDLERSTGVEFRHDREALAITVRQLADAMAAKVPGNSVELRVPPFAAVQCVEGPRHTRGTPPNVVEMAPKTWIRLAAGRMTWDEAMADGAVSASGSRADLRDFLPLMG
ncbi:maleylpyruvate isomerase family mycothiol-dependent enzyme [Catenulispora subtropica]|uniref:Maleylpyruvate isomerase family mycothiol-dependent enzyme n=1 Tax=Catenulispora subtropica TaxID=450798 RepID=A0ABP5BS57_9ACTN